MPSLRGGPCSASADRGRALIDRRGHYVDSYISEPLVTMTYLLALDQGTSSSRSIVFDEGGHIVAQAQLELPQIYPQPGVPSPPAPSCASKAMPPPSRPRPACWWMPTSPAPSCSGCWTMCPAPATRQSAASWPLARWTAG